MWPAGRGSHESLQFEDGIDLSAILEDPESTPSREAIFNVYYGCEFLRVQRMIITDRYKYVFNGFDVDELYDLEIDPSEILNHV
ncbi:MAG: hypothetical protein CMN78_03040 [Spirochaetales bacterium]|nr:hypothetical protein [Spirochaetales bacterium]